MSSEESHKLRAFIDTNILMAAFITEGLCSEILERARDREFLGFTSPFVMNELRKVLDREFSEREFSRAKKETMKLIEEALEIINPDETSIKVEGVCERDPSDNNILAGALASSAKFIVTGDLDLLDLKEFKGIRILKPREFIAKLEGLPSSS
ncbi:MAG TPA: putative toxin-antitoxin system toxin component, PIN family [Thermodesulfobacteriota bacterium]|jgi:putative PIN family toxin of toxin-antitoxin system|nr:putative toxin-antitoxin system toxin component, PIN family [Thermodesulfobacteriota bacterium]